MPKKVADQDIYPLRTLESNAYLWGIVYQTIADATGHTSLEVHEEYKRKYNLRYDLVYRKKTEIWEWKMGTGSTTTLDMREIWEYIMKVRADAEIELRIIIQMPNEVFINELDFEHNIETRRL